MTWSEYETRAWRDIQDRKRSWLEHAEDEDSWSNRAGGHILSTASRAGKQVRKVPGATKATAALGTAVVKAQETLGDLSTRTLSEKRVLKRYAKQGVEATTLKELRGLDLEILDKLVHRRRLNLRYGAVAGLEGGAAGMAVTGGTVVAGSGVAAAPGLGTVTAAMAGDVGFMLALSSRVVADTALHFGFDPNEPDEQLFMMSVINVGSAITQGAKYTALADLSKLTQALVRSAPWTQLSQHALSKVAAKFAEGFGFRLTKNKLGQMVPFVGVGVGATLNYATITSVQAAAYWAYRERLLLEKNPDAVTELTRIESWAPINLSDDEPALELGSLVAEAVDDHG